MAESSDIDDLQGLLDRMCEEAQDSDAVSIDLILEAVGRRAFGPVLLVPGLIGVSPLSGIPGMPTVIGIMVLLIAGQLLIGRDEFWLPGFLLRRSVKQSRFEKAVKALRPVARFVDRLIKPRLEILTRGLAMYVIAALCIALALVTPVMELLPFAITAVGAAITAFALALIADDGLLVILAFTACAITGGVIVHSMM